MLPDTMIAAVYDGHGGPEVIAVSDEPRPTPSDGEVLVKVHAAGLNRADVGQRKGNYPPPPGETHIPGLEVSGTVVAHGPGVRHDTWPLGTPVCALVAGGGYAQYTTVPVGQLLPVPEGTTLMNAAALPEVAATVASNLSYTVSVEPDSWVLVHGGSGGIGTFALQYLSALGARVIATGSTEDKLDWAREHGAAHTINYRTDSFADRVGEITQGHGVDYILDVVGAAYLADNVRALALGGRLVIIGLTGGTHADLDLGMLLTKRAGIIATNLRARPLEEKAQIIARVRELVWPLVAAGSVTVPVDRTFAVEQAQAAHEYFDSGQHRGKVLLTFSDAQ